MYTEIFMKALEEFSNNINKASIHQIPTELARKDKDLEYMNSLVSSLNQQLKDITIKVINENDFEHSQIFSSYISREFMHQLVDRVLSLALKNIEDMKNVHKTECNCQRFLRLAAEMHATFEIYSHRRPIHRHVMKI